VPTTSAIPGLLEPVKASQPCWLADTPRPYDGSLPRKKLRLT
jgi:hypothetical protein